MSDEIVQLYKIQIHLHRHTSTTAPRIFLLEEHYQRYRPSISSLFIIELQDLSTSHIGRRQLPYKQFYFQENFAFQTYVKHFKLISIIDET